MQILEVVVGQKIKNLRIFTVKGGEIENHRNSTAESFNGNNIITSTTVRGVY